jgi:DNA replicative helicase MCM subunit Mcm2 (Cdc46/Mcm family)
MSVDEVNRQGGPLPAQILRKYIAYARKYVKPR